MMPAIGWRKRIPFLITVGIALGLWTAVFTWRLHRELHPPRWESEIIRFEQRDLTNQPPDEAVLFVGSSSVKLWETLRDDLPRFRVFRRGFGGANMMDVVTYADRIILPYDPVMVIVHAGGNDLAAGKTPQRVFQDFQHLVKQLRRANPDLRIGFLSIKPSPARWHLAQRIRETNRLIKDYADQDEHLVFINVFDLMLDPRGQPRRELYAADGLHLNREGYQLWAKAVRPYLSPQARKQLDGLVSVTAMNSTNTIPPATNGPPVPPEAFRR